MDAVRTPEARTSLWARSWPNVVLAVAAALGVVALLTVLATSVLGFRVALVTSGSMQPAIPEGSAALVRTVGADSIQPGDVVSVDRAGQIPVLHRVVGIDDPPGIDGPVRDLTLRGDANDAIDPEPYRVERVGVVVASVAGAGPVIDAFRWPWVPVATVVGVSALVLAALRLRRRDAAVDDERQDVGAPG
jgi:signal peptidase I